MYKKIIPLALLSPILFACSALVLHCNPMVETSANSGPSFTEGEDGTGVVIYENSPLEVSKEVLNFNLSFPETDEWKALDSNVNAKYTFNNPTDAEITTKALFPFSNYPLYLDPSSFDFDGRYFVKINDEIVNKNTRYIYSKEYVYQYIFDNYDFKEALKYYSDDFVSLDHFKPTDIVKKVTLTYSYDETFYFDLALKDDVSCQMLYFTFDNPQISYSSPYTILKKTLTSSSNKFTFYVVGDYSNATYSQSIYSDYSETTKLNINPTISEEDISLKDFILLNKNIPTMNDVDYYNASVNYFNDYFLGKFQSYKSYTKELLEEHLVAYYQYAFTIEPHGSLTNEVQAPIFPTIIHNMSCPVYDFSYLYQPAYSWASFSDLTVNINTSYYCMQLPNEFSKVDGTYTAHYDSLPGSTLSFRASLDENPYYKTNDTTVIFFIFFIFALGFVLSIIAGIIVLFVILFKKH